MSDCGDVHCVTCADEGVPMRVLETGTDGLAECVDEAGFSTTVMTGLVRPLAAGESVLVHAGVALAVIERAEHVR